MESERYAKGRIHCVVDFADTVNAVDEALPTLARNTIRDHLDLSNPHNELFLSEPDRRDQHQIHWHSWGILTHTRVFLQLFDTVVPEKLCSWHMWDKVHAVLADTIDGVAKWDLLKVSILLHDIGKFGARTHGKGGFHFSGHERLSGALIRHELDLRRYGLTQSQIEYVARTAEDHFVLGLVRKRARETGTFTSDFPRSERFRELAASIKEEHPDDYIEIGVLFLGDSLSKVDAREGPERALSQSPINEAIARAYLAVVLGRESPNGSL